MPIQRKNLFLTWGIRISLVPVILILLALGLIAIVLFAICGVCGRFLAALGGLAALLALFDKCYQEAAVSAIVAFLLSPYGAPQVLKQYGVQYEEYTDPDALEREAGEGDVMIVSIWNRKGTIFEGYHTFAVQKVNGELMVYNRFNNSAESTEKKTMGEVIENGQFIVGYRVQNAG